MQPTTPTPISTELSQELRKILTKLHLWSKKASVIKDFTMEDKTHIHQLTDNEGVRVYNYLQEKDVQANNMRRKMLSLGYEMSYDAPLSKAQQMMDAKRVNFVNVSAWCEKSSKIKKPLDKLDPFELVEVLQQFEQVRIGYTRPKSKTKKNV